jgi:hypothetical protein
MALRLSSALRNFVQESGSMKMALSNCFIRLYSGAQPATGDAAPTGTLLVTYSKSGGAITREVLSVGSVALTGGGAGSLDTLTVNSLEIMGSATSFNSTLAQTAQDIVDKINNNPKNVLFTASKTATSTITLTAKPGLGSLPNGWVVASTATTITKTDSNMAGGVTAVNGLTWGDSAAGVLVKNPVETWQGTAVATGTAGYFRIEAAVSDAGALDSSELVIRLDGAVATSGAELNMASTSVVSAAVQTLSSFSITLPTA